MKKLIVCLSVVALAAACSKPAAGPQKTANMPPDHPTFNDRAAAAPATTLQGTVLEKLDSGGFSYLRLKTPAGEQWMVTSPVDVKVGDAVTVNAAMTVDKFESKSMKRTFDKIIFGSIQGAHKLDVAHGGAAPAEASPVANVNVEKATGPNAKTVAEIWAGKGALKDGKVVVRGTVVKFLPSIMGKNWLHLRDGSGAAAKGDNDIAVITDDQAKVGSVVTVSGTVRVDKDFGAGYSYPVILDEAKLK